MYGGDEVSTINQRRLVLARRIVTKLVVSNAMSDTPELADRMISHPVRHGERSLRQVILRKVRLCPALCAHLRSPALHAQRVHNVHHLVWGCGGCRRVQHLQHSPCHGYIRADYFLHDCLITVPRKAGLCRKIHDCISARPQAAACNEVANMTCSG